MGKVTKKTMEKVDRIKNKNNKPSIRKKSVKSHVRFEKNSDGGMVFKCFVNPKDITDKGVFLLVRDKSFDNSSQQQKIDPLHFLNEKDLLSVKSKGCKDNSFGQSKDLTLYHSSLAPNAMISVIQPRLKYPITKTSAMLILATAATILTNSLVRNGLKIDKK